MKTKRNSIITICLLIVVLISGCKKKKEDIATPQSPGNETGLITSLKIVFDDLSPSNNDVVAVFEDLDGVGINPPTIQDTIKLKRTKNYIATIYLLDKSKTPVDTLSNNVLLDANNYQFFFTFTGISINKTYLDQDNNSPSLPIGLRTQWFVGGGVDGNIIEEGTTQIMLKKYQQGTKDGMATTGDEVIKVLFYTRIDY